MSRRNVNILDRTSMPEEKKKLQIRLHLYDTDMAVNINRDDEELYRKAAKLITDTVNTYANLFKGRKSEKEILYMALVDIALRCEKTDKRNDTVPYNHILSQLTKEIEEVL